MYISTKVAIAALAATAGVSIPIGYFAADDEPARLDDEAAEPVAREPLAPADDTPLPVPQYQDPPPSQPGDDEVRLRDPYRGPPGPAVPVEPPVDVDPPEPAATMSDFPPPTAAPAPAPRPPEPVIERQSPVSCGPVACTGGQVCCNASCGICTEPGASCTNKDCSRPEAPLSELCGPNTCNVGQVCCNRSCGICTAPGETCSQRRCNGPVVPFSVTCGMNTCNVGEVCCNPSCGICAAPGASCDQKRCWH
jgi:hypothetical protein